MQEILNKIIAECPKAWEEFVKTGIPYALKTGKFRIDENDIVYQTYDSEGLTEEKYNFRNLYDYFDNKDIRVSAWAVDLDTTFEYAILTKNFYEAGLYDYDVRPEAEWNGFYKAFKIREAQL